MPEDEWQRFESLARENRLSLGDWVRKTLREAADDFSNSSAEQKREALTRATQFSFPVGDVEVLNQEIDQGYRADLP